MKTSYPLLLLALSISCQEPDPVDPRDEWVGSYSYTIAYYNEDFTPKTDFNSGLDIAGLLHFEKATEPGSFDLSIDGIGFPFHCHSITVSENGYTFMIEDILFFMDFVGTQTISGFANAELDGGKYQGVMKTDEKSIHFFLKDTGPAYTIYVEVKGTRN